MRNVRGVVALLAGVGLVALAVSVAVALTSRAGEEEARPAEPTGTVSPREANITGAILNPTPSPTATTTAASAAAGTSTAATTISATPGTRTMTPQESGEAEAMLRAAALRPEDIPEGFRMEDESFITNEELKETKELLVETMGPLGGATPEDLNRWGRILGYNATYGPEEVGDPASFSGTLSLHVSVDLFQDSTGAHEYVEQAGELALQQSDPQGVAWHQLQEYYQSLGLELSDLKVSSLSVAEVGEERVAWETRATIRFSDGDLHVVQQVVGLRRGSAAGSIGLVAVSSAPPVGQLESLARTLDERLKDALE